MAWHVIIRMCYGTTPSEGSKRRYPAHFLSKLTDADGELQETLHWLMTARDCNYLTGEEFQQLHDQQTAIGRKLGTMMNLHESFCFGPNRNTEPT